MSDVGFIPTTRQVREAYEVAHEEVGVPCDIAGFDRWLNDIIQQAKAEALEAARDPYRCCLHCADDIIHDVEKDDHTVPCQLCQNDVIRRAKADALRDFAAGYQGPMAQVAKQVAWSRADQIEAGR